MVVDFKCVWSTRLVAWSFMKNYKFDDIPVQEVNWCVPSIPFITLSIISTDIPKLMKRNTLFGYSSQK